MPDRNFAFEIEEHFGTISSREGWNKELNLIRWNGGPAKYDIREWDEHHERMKKGVTMTAWEMRKMMDLFFSRNNDAAVARGKAIEAERNARRIAARQRAEAAALQVEHQAEGDAEEQARMEQMEQEALEGAVPPFAESPSQEPVPEEAQCVSQDPAPEETQDEKLNQTQEETMDADF